MAEEEPPQLRLALAFVKVLLSVEISVLDSVKGMLSMEICALAAVNGLLFMEISVLASVKGLLAKLTPKLLSRQSGRMP